MVHEIDGAREAKEDDAHDHSETDEVPHGVSECSAEDSDRLVITQYVQQLKLCEEGDDADHK